MTLRRCKSAAHNSARLLALAVSLLGTVAVAGPTEPERSATKAAPAQTPPAVFLNGKYLALGVLVNGRAYVSVRAVSEGLGAAVTYDAVEGSVSIEAKDTSVPPNPSPKDEPGTREMRQRLVEREFAQAKVQQSESPSKKD